MRGHGQIRVVGVENTGSFGASLARFPAGRRRVVEVNRPNRLARRMDASPTASTPRTPRVLFGETSTAGPKQSPVPSGLSAPSQLSMVGVADIAARVEKLVTYGVAGP